MEQIKLTFATIKEAKLYKYVIVSIVLALIVVALFIAASISITATVLSFESSWLTGFLATVVGLLTGVGGWFLLPSLVILISGIFQESVISKVEAKYYPEKVREEEPRFFADIKHDVRFALLSIAINIIILPLYIFGIGFAVAIIANTYLLGREFFENVAGYHIGKADAKVLGRSHKSLVYTNGFVFTLASLTPILNLFTPVLATVWMTHRFHKNIELNTIESTELENETNSETNSPSEERI